jgi:hypothetical protein
MPRVRDLLYRFRPAGAPGAASSAGVPVDRGADLAAELDPVFARLAATERECAEIVAAAHGAADARRAQAAQQARACVATARERLDDERAAAAAVRRSGGPEADALDDSQAEVSEVRRRADERMGTYVDRVVDRVLPLVGEPPAGAPWA